jgi:uncharacterized protein YcbK (DUF882 family)
MVVGIISSPTRVSRKEVYTEMRIWKLLNNFTKNENWGASEKMNPVLLLLLDKLRDKVGHIIRINCGYSTDGHAIKSQHYLGNAVDFVVVGTLFDQADRLLQEALLELKVEDEVGLGCYPFWNTPGFHLDIRGERARWGRNAKGEYVSYDCAIKEWLDTYRRPQ